MMDRFEWLSYPVFSLSFWFTTGIALAAIICIEVYMFVFGDADAFQRLGSALVAFCVFSYARTSNRAAFFERLYEEQDEKGVAMHHAHVSGLQAIYAERLANFLNLWGVIIGTLQWGYGDLLHRFLRGDA